MALIPGTAAHVMNALQPNVEAPSTHNAYEHKVVNADIRIRSVKDDTTADNAEVPREEIIEHSQPGVEDVSEHERADEMRTWWNNAMKKHMDQPDGYAKVSVLLIKWADELDELETMEEAQELRTLFRDRFNYQTKLAELDVRKKAQHSLDSHVKDFIRDHDGPHHLLIVYYTGHGSYRSDKKFLELTATEDPAACKGIAKAAHANWNKVEDMLKDEDVEADVLTILDTCYASNHVKSAKEDTRKFELLSACAMNQTTAAPGENSFTRALIDGLKEMLLEYKDRPMSTFRIAQRINLDKRRNDTPAHLWSRGQSTENHIFLTPLGGPKTELAQPSKIRHTPGGYLTLKFGIRDSSLNQEQIEYMTMTLSKALNNRKLVGLREVKWIKMEAAPPIPHFDRVALVMSMVAQWKKVIKRIKTDRESQLATQRSVDQISLPQHVDRSPTISQKRSQDEFEDLPYAKRQNLESPCPPLSPPVSTSSRAG